MKIKVQQKKSPNINATTNYQHGEGSKIYPGPSLLRALRAYEQ